jgi:hypothetical protein
MQWIAGCLRSTHRRYGDVRLRNQVSHLVKITFWEHLTETWTQVLVRAACAIRRMTAGPDKRVHFLGETARTVGCRPN